MAGWQIRAGSLFRTRRVLLVCCLSASLLSPDALGESRQIFDGPDGVLSIRSASQHGEIYGQARRRAKWHVSQWNNPSGDIPDFERGVAGNASLVVRASSRAGSINIHQTGSLLSCGERASPREFDSFVGTNTTANNPGLPSALRAEPARSIGMYRSLLEKISVRVDQAGILSKSPACPVNKAVGLIAIVLTNETRSATLFLQTIVFAFNSRPHSNWWARGARNSRYGYNIVVPDATDSWRPHMPQEFDIDILPEIKRLLADRSTTIDPNINHWAISGGYFGNAIYGGVEISSDWIGFNLVAQD